MSKGLNEHTFEALNLLDLITAINIENKFFDRLPEFKISGGIKVVLYYYFKNI